MHQHKAIKIHRLPSLSILSSLLNQSEHNNYLLYTVRDPRGVVSSRFKLYNLKLEGHEDVIYEDAKALCDSYLDNVRYLRTVLRHGCSHVTSRIRVLRYEDVAYDVTGKAEEIFR